MTYEEHIFRGLYVLIVLSLIRLRCELQSLFTCSFTNFPQNIQREKLKYDLNGKLGIA
jgi:hypothetical protein